MRLKKKTTKRRTSHVTTKLMITKDGTVKTNMTGVSVSLFNNNRNRGKKAAPNPSLLNFEIKD